MLLVHRHLYTCNIHVHNNYIIHMSLYNAHVRVHMYGSYMYIHACR